MSRLLNIYIYYMQIIPIIFDKVVLNGNIKYFIKKTKDELLRDEQKKYNSNLLRRQKYQLKKISDENFLKKQNENKKKYRDKIKNNK